MEPDLHNFAAGRKRRNNLKKSTTTPTAQAQIVEFIHILSQQWTQEPRMPSFAQSGLMTPQTPSNFDQRPFTTRCLERYDYHQAAMES
jgi:hypothetical protein